MRSARGFCRSPASVYRSISFERLFARRTVPKESKTISASPLDSKTAPNAPPSRSCIISARGVAGILRSAVRTLPVRLAFRRFGMLESPTRLHDPIAAKQCHAYREGIFKRESSKSKRTVVDCDTSRGWHVVSNAQRRPCS